MKNHISSTHKRTCDLCDFIIHNKEHKEKHMKVRHNKSNGLLWVADSVNSNVDFKYLTRITNMNIKAAKAYTAVYDDSARFPTSNFFDVVVEQLKTGRYEVLVLGGGCVDISNIDTQVNPNKIYHN